MTVYLETNFLVGVATGRVHDAAQLLGRAGPGLRFAIPAVCFFEAAAWREGELKRRRAFDLSIKDQITQLDRDLVSSRARALSALLRQALVVSRNVLISTESRLANVTLDVSRAAELIGLGPALLERSRDTPVIEEMTDNLILHCILDHARANPSEAKLFLSGNTKDFGAADVRRALRAAGVEHYFTDTQDVLGWLGSRPVL